MNHAADLAKYPLIQLSGLLRRALDIRPAGWTPTHTPKGDRLPVERRCEDPGNSDGGPTRLPSRCVATVSPIGSNIRKVGTTGFMVTMKGALEMSPLVTTTGTWAEYIIPPPKKLLSGLLRGVNTLIWSSAQEGVVAALQNQYM